MKALLVFMTMLCGLINGLSAHPVSQGAMEIMADPQGVTIHARVSNEEAFVADAFGRAGAAADLSALWSAHGDYLLQHLHVIADGADLPGRVVKMVAPADTSSEGRINYDLRFDLAPGRERPSSITVRQDVLNELEFAPGNRWEATYVTKLGQVGGASQEALLFTARDPLVLRCDWSTAGAAGPKSQLNRWQLFREYFRHGVIHILSGYDHLLFVSALVLAAITVGDLVRVVSAFTLAHTVTLTLSVLGIVRLPSHIVEPIIAASIVAVALQNVLFPARSRGWSRYALAFGFGLFHGLGFAGGLLQAMEGLAGGTIALAIIAFSIGVEFGHSMVVLPLFGALRLVRSYKRDAEEQSAALAQRYGSLAICCAGMFYLVAALRG